MPDPRFDALRSAGAAHRVVDAIEKAVAEAPGAELVNMNLLAFAAARGLDETETVSAFCHAVKLGLFDIAWEVTCPACGGILGASVSLRTLKHQHLHCSTCAADVPVELDDVLAPTFTVSPKLRDLDEHHPERLSVRDYYRTFYYGPGMALPASPEFDAVWDEFVLDHDYVPAREKVTLSTHIPAGRILVFDPVTHTTVLLEAEGEPTRERQDLVLAYTHAGVTPQQAKLRPGPLRLALETRTDLRLAPSLMLAGDHMVRMFKARRAYLGGKRLFTNQTFRDLFHRDALDVDQTLRLTSLTVLFTDLRGSTEMYDRIGDLTAYEIVQTHFHVLGDVIRARGGAVVKTIGDAVMATFPTPSSGLEAALSMREAMDRFNREHKQDDLILKIGLHEGPCLAVMSNERLDYFGQTVNVASRVQGLATTRAIFATAPVIHDEKVQALLTSAGLSPTAQRAALRGIRDELVVYEIP